jgi:uncharacterized membrane protein YhhN
MASTAGFSSPTDMRPPYAHSRTRLFWAAAVFAAAGYGLFLVVTAVRLRSGAELTGQFALQPAVKVLTVAVAALAVPIWWAHATSLLLITAGFFFGRPSEPSATPS